MAGSTGSVNFRIRPENIDEASMPLVEAFFIAEHKSKKLGNPWHQVAALQFARRTMEVAIHSSMFASDERSLPAHADDWTGMTKRAQAASDALADLLNFMSVEKPDLIGALSPRHLKPSVMQLVRQEQRDIHPEQQEVLATKLATELLGGLAATTRIAGISGAMRQRIKGAIKNVGEPEKAAFAKVWAEGWLALFWRRPSSSRSETNGFAAFLADAWEDATGVREQSFAASIGRATNGLPKTLSEPWLPHWA